MGRALELYSTQLRLHRIGDVDVSVCDLWQHSIWSLLSCESFLAEEFTQWQLSNEHRRIIAFAAFLHDITRVCPENAIPSAGKFYYATLDAHPNRGAGYLLGAIDFPVISKPNENLDIRQLFHEFGINYTQNCGWVTFIIRMHREFGTLFMKIQNEIAHEKLLVEDFIEKSWQFHRKYKVSVPIKLAIASAITVGLADMRGGYQHHVSHFFPFLENESCRLHVSGFPYDRLVAELKALFLRVLRRV